MTDNTINNDMTMGGATATLLAGRYRVVRQLGQGGMGSVWLAEDTKLDGFKVAIKMLPSVLVNNKRAYAQVKAEALVSLKLSHPNIVTVRAFEEEGGSPFLVMDYIDGQTLDDYLAEKGKLTEDETVKLLKPVAAALDYAHTQGVVHRDVKPGNIMIRKDGTPFVLDFGIAREIQETMTRVTGKLSSGTLLYMSPEQLRGTMPTPAQDIYSFAAMAYECLTGNPPFARGQVEYQIEHVEPAPLGPQFIKCGPGVAAGLGKLPENRPASCTAVLVSSRGNGGVRSPRQIPVSRQEAPRSPARTAGGKGLVVGLIAALVLAGAGVYHYISAKNAEHRRLSEAQETFERALTSLDEYERKIEKLSREDGFGSRIDEITEKIPLRSALKNASSFLSAAERCADLEKGCRQLLTADELRIRAKTVRNAAQQARQKAQEQYASQEAKQTWQAAESAYEQGRRELSQFDFERAVQSFTLSGQHYEKAASGTAAAREERQKAERAQQEQKAKEEELRKKNEKEIVDLRAACETAKKTAEDAEASVFASKEMSDALKLLSDADNASDGDRKQTYQVALNAFERARQMAKETSKPKLTLKAMLNGEEVNATVTSGLKDKTRKTPVTVDLSDLKVGSSFEFELAYLRDGVPYSGRGHYTVKKGNEVLAVKMFVGENWLRQKLNTPFSIVGKWKSTYTQTREESRSTIWWMLTFNQDGTFYSDREGGRLKGTWKFSNPKLELNWDHLLGIWEYRVISKPGGEFELRCWDVDAYLKQMKKSGCTGVTSLRYDGQGNVHRTFKTGLWSEQETVESPKCFRRIGIGDDYAGNLVGNAGKEADRRQIYPAAKSNASNMNVGVVRDQKEQGDGSQMKGRGCSFDSSCTFWGKWTSSTVCGNNGMAVSSRRYDFHFYEDGTFKCEWMNAPLKTNVTCTVIEQGTWSYAEDRLKLSYVSSRTRYSTGWAFDNKNPPSRLLIVIWRSDGSFELRRDPDEMKREMLRVKVSDVEVYYDENGTLHYGAKLPGGRAYSSTETAKIFKRVQIAAKDVDEG